MDYGRKEKNKFKISNVQSHRVNKLISFNFFTYFNYVFIILEKFIKYNQKTFAFFEFHK